MLHSINSLARRWMCVLVGAMSASLGCGPGGESSAAEPQRLVFGIPSTESSVQLARAWTPLLRDLEQALGVAVKPFFATDYAGVIEAMRSGHVDLAWFGNKAAIEAVDRADGEVFAQMVDGDGHAGYWSVLVVREDGPLRSIDDVVAASATLSIGIGDPNSTSGHVVPMAELFGPRGLDPRRDFARMLQGNHESNALAVALGHVDVAPVDSKVLRRLASSHPERFASLREVWRSTLIPSDTLCWRKSLSDDTKARVRAALVGYGSTNEERAVLAGLDLARFQTSNDAQLLPVRLMELTKQRLQLEAQVGLAPAERAERLAELDTRWNAVERALTDAAELSEGQ